MSKTDTHFFGWLRRIPLAVVVPVVGVAVVVGLMGLRGRPEVAPEIKPPVVNVQVAQVVPFDLNDMFVLKGDVEPWTTLRLSAETVGRIEKITVKEGDPVRPGLPLVYLEDDLLKASAAQAQAKAEFDVREVGRFTAAQGGGATTEMEMDGARSAAAGSKAAMDLAAAQLRRAVIRAPDRIHDAICNSDQIGRVNDLPVEIGEYVQPGQVVAEIVETRYLRVVVQVPELDIRHLKAGQETDIVIEALDNRKVRGKIHYIESVADPSTRTFRTEILLPNPAQDIRPGMFVRVELLRRQIANAIMIPFDAAAPLEKGYEVFISRDGKAHRLMVEFDQDVIHEKLILVKAPETGEGLKAGDRLIIQGQRMLGDGQTIREQPAPAQLLADLGLPAAMTVHPAAQPVVAKE